MKAKMIPVAILALMLSPIDMEAQKRQYLRIRERPLVWFTFPCAKEKAYPKRKLDPIVKTYLNKIPGDFAEWGDRAFAFDLNGDGIRELFVPLDCGGTGNCNWGVFSINPVRSLRIINGQHFWVHKSKAGWSQLTVASHLNVSESILRTYRFTGGEYRRYGEDYIESAYKENYIEGLFSVEPICDPDGYRKNSGVKANDSQKPPN